MQLQLRMIRRFARAVLCSVALVAVAVAASPVAMAASSHSKSKVKAKSAERKVAKVSTRKRVTLSSDRRAAANNATRKLMSKSSKRVVAGNKASRKVVASSRRRPAQLVSIRPAPPTVGEMKGLRGDSDSLDLNSSVALVVDQDTSEVLFSKNDSAVLPIASLTKLMTGLIIAESDLPMNEELTITSDDVDYLKGSRSRLSVGTTLTRGEMLHLALMSSENRAANALGRTYPGGLDNFVRRMNEKARQLGMYDTRYVEPTGLKSQNQSSARDLATLVAAAYHHPVLRDLSTDPSHQVSIGRRTLNFVNSNRLVRGSDWDIGLQKTGYISEAGRCLVMQANVAGRRLIMVFLDSAGKSARIQDAQRVRRWVESLPLPVQASVQRIHS